MSICRQSLCTSVKRVPVAYTSCQHADECSQGCIESTLSALTTTPSQYCQAGQCRIHCLVGGTYKTLFHHAQPGSYTISPKCVQLCKSLDQIRSWHTSSGIMQSTLGCGRLSGRSQASLCNCRLKARGLSALTAAPAVVAVTGLLQSRAQRWPSTRLRSIWDDSLTLSDLREKLDAAVAAEDYAEAARIRDSLQ